MELKPSPNKTSRDISTQTDLDSNKGKGLSKLQENKHYDFMIYLRQTTKCQPQYTDKILCVYSRRKS